MLYRFNYTKKGSSTIVTEQHTYYTIAYKGVDMIVEERMRPHYSTNTKDGIGMRNKRSAVAGPVNVRQ